MSKTNEIWSFIKFRDLVLEIYLFVESVKRRITASFTQKIQIYTNKTDIHKKLINFSLYQVVISFSKFRKLVFEVECQEYFGHVHE